MARDAQIDCHWESPSLPAALSGSSFAPSPKCRNAAVYAPKCLADRWTRPFRGRSRHGLDAQNQMDVRWQVGTRPVCLALAHRYLAECRRWLNKIDICQIDDKEQIGKEKLNKWHKEIPKMNHSWFHYIKCLVSEIKTSINNWSLIWLFRLIGQRLVKVVELGAAMGRCWSVKKWCFDAATEWGAFHFVIELTDRARAGWRRRRSWT